MNYKKTSFHTMHLKLERIQYNTRPLYCLPLSFPYLCTFTSVRNNLLRQVWSIQWLLFLTLKIHHAIFYFGQFSCQQVCFVLDSMRLAQGIIEYCGFCCLLCILALLLCWDVGFFYVSAHWTRNYCLFHRGLWSHHLFA
jgi:hypothetical protein